jgi:hypothetical protein
VLRPGVHADVGDRVGIEREHISGEPARNSSQAAASPLHLQAARVTA